MVKNRSYYDILNSTDRRSAGVKFSETIPKWYGKIDETTGEKLLVKDGEKRVPIHENIQVQKELCIDLSKMVSVDPLGLQKKLNDNKQRASYLDVSQLPKTRAEAVHLNNILKEYGEKRVDIIKLAEKELTAYRASQAAAAKKTGEKTGENTNENAGENAGENGGNK